MNNWIQQLQIASAIRSGDLPTTTFPIEPEVQISAVEASVGQQRQSQTLSSEEVPAAPKTKKSGFFARRK